MQNANRVVEIVEGYCERQHLTRMFAFSYGTPYPCITWFVFSNASLVHGMTDEGHSYERCYAEQSLCPLAGESNCTVVDRGYCTQSFQWSTYCTDPNITAEHCTPEVRVCSHLNCRF